MSGVQPEVILAQEQGANMRSGGARSEVGAEFGVGVREGTLVLTNRRLIFVCTDDKGEELPIGFASEHLLLYSEVEDLGDIPHRTPNIFIPLEAVSTKGHKEGLGRPSLEVTWADQGGSHGVVFTETLLGRRKRNLNDWAAVIDGIKRGTQKLIDLPAPPPTDSLEGEVMHIMADMQEKGLFEIEEAVEGEYKVDLDPDQVQSACDGLVSLHLMTRTPDPSGDAFYRRVSPLGEDDFSS